MARFYKIHITGTAGNVWLTHDGTEAGRPCRNVSVPAANILLTPEIGNTTVGDAGNPFNETGLDDGAGRGFDIIIPRVPTAVYDSLKAIIDAMIVAKDECNVTGTQGEPGDFDADFIQRNDPVPLEYDGFSIGYVHNVKIHGITTAIN